MRSEERKEERRHKWKQEPQHGGHRLRLVPDRETWRCSLEDNWDEAGDYVTRESDHGDS